MPVFLIATIQCPGSYGTYFNGPISIPCHIVLSTQIGLLYRYTLVLANPPTGVFCYCCLVSRYSCTLYRYVRLSIADISWLQVPYILESIPHPNLIRISFCRFLKRKKKLVRGSIPLLQKSRDGCRLHGKPS